MKFSILFALSFLFFQTSNAQNVADTGNFHEIDPGKYYRSAQLTPWDLEDYILQYGIKTVINLRGANPDATWFRREVEMTQKHNVTMINIPMSADTIPHKKNLIMLLEAFKNLPRPLLVHCQAGADRTGEASAIYQMLYMGKSRSQAMKMLSFRYGHLSFAKPAKDYFIKSVWQGLEWAYKDYDPCKGQYKYYDVKNPYCKP